MLHPGLPYDVIALAAWLPSLAGGAQAADPQAVVTVFGASRGASGDTAAQTQQHAVSAVILGICAATMGQHC